MAHSPKLSPLDYRTLPAPQKTPRRPPETFEERMWRLRRVAYYAALTGALASIAFYFGPNWFIFGKLTRLSPADFVSFVDHDGVPVVRAVKLYHRDTGQYPADVQELPASYLKGRSNFSPVMYPGEIVFFGPWHEEIVYDLTPGKEGWSVRGPFANGAIPATPTTINIDGIPASQR